MLVIYSKALIIESYGALRAEFNRVENDKLNICLICNLNKDDIYKKTDKLFACVP